MKVALLSLLTSSIALAAPAFAQSEALRPGGVLPASLAGPMEPADRLAMSLRMLSQNPYDIGALTQAGESALAVGDANAAISFLARAEELSPASGRIKASLGGALVLVERPADSFRLFSEALALGVPEHQLARDRGLAYDLTGDPRRAQRDYVLALRHGADDETVRRYALSLGMSGEKEQALKQLEPLTRRRDQGAWRARAFILAMNGDERGAVRIAEQVMTPDMMPTFITFARRLSLLTPAQKAAAVNFGTMPATDMRMAQASTNDVFRPIGDTALASLEPVPVSAPAAVVAATDTNRSRERRRRPGREEVQTALATQRPAPPVAPAAPASVTRPQATTPSWSEAPVSRRLGERIAPVDRSLLPPEARGERTGAVRVVSQTDMRDLPAPTAADRMASAPVVAALAARAAAVQPTPVAPAPVMPTPAVQVAPPPPALVKPVVVKPVDIPAPIFEVAAVAPQPAQLTPPSPAPAPAPVAVAPPAPDVVAAPLAPQPLAVVAKVGPTTIVAPSPPTPALVATVEPLPVPAAAAPKMEAVPPQVASAPPAPGFSDAVTPGITGPPLPPVAAVVTPLPAEAPPAPLPSNADAALVQGAANPNPAPVAAVVPAPALIVAAAPSPFVAPAPTAPAPEPGLSSVLSGLSLEQESSVGPVLSEAEFRRARLAAKRKAEAEASADSETKLAAEAKAKEEAEKLRIAKANPERIWVQVATGSNRSGLSGTLGKLRDQAPDALKGLGGASVPFKATNRVLVGPFKSQAEARAVINKLSKQGVSATSFTSTAGQEVSKLPSR